MRLFTIHHRGTPRKAKPLDHGSERASSGALGEARRRHSHAALCDAAFDFGKHKGKSFKHKGDPPKARPWSLIPQEPARGTLLLLSGGAGRTRCSRGGRPYVDSGRS